MRTCRAEEREAGRLALERLAAKEPHDPEAQLAAGLAAYFMYGAPDHPGVCAAEALLSMLRSGQLNKGTWLPFSCAC